MLLFYYYIACPISISIIASFAHASKANFKASKDGSLEVDKLIEKLMTSEKFEELADVIAKKAVKIIKDMASNTAVLRSSNEKDANINSRSNEQNEQRSKDKGAGEFAEHQQSIENAGEYEENQEIAKDDAPEYEESQKRGKVNKTVKFGEIDTQAFLKDHITSEELKLNFKHITKQLEKNKSKNKGNIGPKKVDVHNKIKRNQQGISSKKVNRENILKQESRKPHEGKKTIYLNPKPLKKIDSRSNNNDHREKILDDNVKYSNSAEIKVHNYSEEHVGKERVDDFKTMQNTTTKVGLEEYLHSNELNSKTEPINDDDKIASTMLKSPTSSSKEVMEVGILSRSNTNKAKPLEPQRSTLKKSFMSNTNRTSSENIIHETPKKNGRPYSFESSSDYEVDFQETAKTYKKLAII